MITQQIYSLMALHVYAAGVLSNKPILPTPWTEILQTPGSNGFACAVYKNTVTNEVVISFRGTDNDLGDWAANLGWSLSHEKQAAAVYANVLRDHGTDAAGNDLNNISFTGHSLGGGLAATMAVGFNRPAVVFDPAPTQLAATNAVDVAKVMASMTGPVPQAFVDYLADIGPLFGGREPNVTSYYAPGSVVFAGSTSGNTITGAGQGNAVQFGNLCMGGGVTTVASFPPNGGWARGQDIDTLHAASIQGRHVFMELHCSHSFTQPCGRTRRASVPARLRARGWGACGARPSSRQHRGLCATSAATANGLQRSGTATRHVCGFGGSGGEQYQAQNVRSMLLSGNNLPESSMDAVSPVTRVQA